MVRLGALARGLCAALVLAVLSTRMALALDACGLAVDPCHGQARSEARAGPGHAADDVLCASDLIPADQAPATGSRRRLADGATALPVAHRAVPLPAPRSGPGRLERPAAHAPRTMRSPTLRL